MECNIKNVHIHYEIQMTVSVFVFLLSGVFVVWVFRF